MVERYIVEDLEKYSRNSVLIQEVTDRLESVARNWKRLLKQGVDNGVYESMPTNIKDFTELVTALPFQLTETESNVIKVLMADTFPLPSLKPEEAKAMKRFIDFPSLRYVFTFLRTISR